MKTPAAVIYLTALCLGGSAISAAPALQLPGRAPNQLTLRGERLLVLNSGDQEVAPELLLLDRSPKLLRQIPLDKDSNPYHFAWREQSVYLTLYGSDSLLRLDLNSGQSRVIFRPIAGTTLAAPQGIAMHGQALLATYTNPPYDEDGALVYLPPEPGKPQLLSLPAKNPQELIELTDQTWAISAGPFPARGQPPQGKLLMVGLKEGHITLLTERPLGAYPGRMSYQAGRRELFICEGSQAAAYRFSLEHNTVEQIPLGAKGWCSTLASTPLGSYFINGSSGELTALTAGGRCLVPLGQALGDPRFAKSWLPIDLAFDAEKRGLWLLTSVVPALGFIPLGADGRPQGCR